MTPTRPPTRPPADCGFRKGSIEEYGNSAFGGVEPFATKEQLDNPALLAQGSRAIPLVDPNAPPSFRQEVRGVVPGYTGFIPRKHTKFGESRWGQVGGNPSKAQGMPQAADPISRDKGDKMIGVSQRVKPGYSAHVPGARDSFGASTSTTYEFADELGQPA